MLRLPRTIRRPLTLLALASGLGLAVVACDPTASGDDVHRSANVAEKSDAKADTKGADAKAADATADSKGAGPAGNAAPDELAACIKTCDAEGASKTDHATCVLTCKQSHGPKASRAQQVIDGYQQCVTRCHDDHTGNADDRSTCALTCQTEARKASETLAADAKAPRSKVPPPPADLDTRLATLKTCIDGCRSAREPRTDRHTCELGCAQAARVDKP